MITMQKLPASLIAATLLAAQFPLSAETAQASALLQALQPYCGKAFAGKLVSNAAEDAAMAGQQLIVHVANCRAGEVRMPFHVGEDRSRTWVLRALPQGLQLKHDHRHQDGTSDALTMYGGSSADAASALTVNFPADAYSQLMFQALGRTVSQTNVWSFRIEPGQQLIYRLRRPGREFAVAFDLTRPVALPPAAWGAVQHDL